MANANVNSETGVISDEAASELVQQWFQGDLNTSLSFEELSKTADAVVLNPYSVLNADKDELIGVPFVILRGRIKRDEQYDSEFAIIHVVDKENRQFVLTDGSTGIYKQYVSLVNEYARDGGFLIANGLTRSDYDYVDPTTGKKSPATTYYLA